MIAWASIVSLWDTYVLHATHGAGELWWSGPGSDIGEFSILVAILGSLYGYYKHHQCEWPPCKKIGHPHPDHQRPVCRDHYHHDVVPAQSQS